MSTEEEELTKAILISVAGSYPDSEEIVSRELSNPQQLKRVLSRLDDATEDLKHKVQKIAQAHGLDWEDLVDRQVCKDSDILGLENESKTAFTDAMEPEVIAKKTEELVRAREGLGAQDEEVERIKQVVAHLQLFHNLYMDADTAILNMDYSSSISLMDRSEDELRILRDLVAEAHIVYQCIDRIGNLRLLASESLEDIWNSMVRVDKTTGSVSMHDKISRGTRSVSLLSICQGLEAMNTLEELAARLSQQIERYVLPYALDCTSRIQLTGNILTFVNQPETPFLSLTILIQFLCDKLSSSAKAELSKSLSPVLLKVLLHDTLPKSIPIGVADLLQYGHYLAEVDRFEAFISAIGFLETSSLSHWTSMAKFEWLKNRESSYLELAREAAFSPRNETRSVERRESVRKENMETERNGSINKFTKHPIPQSMPEEIGSNGGWENDDDGWHLDSDIVVDDPESAQYNEFDEWNWEESPKKLGSQGNTHVLNQVLEIMKISSIPDAITRLIQQVLSEAINLQDADIQESLATPSVTDFLQIISSIVAVYRSLCSTCYITFANGSMLAYNDCLYLEENLSRTDKVRADDCETLRKTAYNLYRSELTERVVTIYNELDMTEGFVNCSQLVQAQVCESVIESLCRQTRDCAIAWSGVLGPLSLHQAVGALINAAVSRFIDDVQSIQDISEKDSTAIASYISTVSTLELLFPTENENSTVARYCPNWLKFQYLKEILEGTLVDIMYLFHEGALVDFSNKELVRLIEALFAETDNRQKAIDEIRRA